MAIVSEDNAFGRGIGVGYGAPAAYGGFGGFGGDGLGLIALLALLGRGGFGGFGNDGRASVHCEKDCATSADLNGLRSAIDTDTILGKLASIESAIPFNEAQVQLALNAVQNALSAQGTIQTNGINNNITQVLLGQLTSTAAIQKSICDVDTNIDRSTTLLQTAIHADGNETRALITTNLINSLQADKVILANALAEERAERRRDGDRHGIEINMTTNQAQAQLQFQEQRQALNAIQNHLWGVSGQLAKATNSNVVVGSTGVGTQQTANPTNVNS